MTPEQRFMDYFDDTVQWGEGKIVNIKSSKERAFKEANYLMFPKHKRKYLVVDVDYEYAIFSWDDNMLPQPTIICMNPKNGHAHLLWELKTRIYWNPFIYGPNKPKKYFRAVQKAFEKNVNGDPGYTHASTKNPFSSMWKTFWTDVSYDLNDLSEYVSTYRKDYWNEKADAVFSGRNDELFYFARKYSYRALSKAQTREELEQLIKEYCDYYNEEEIPFHWHERGKLEQSEVNALCRGVARWTWMHREDPSMKQRIKNIGAMKLEPIGQIKNQSIHEKEVKLRQSSGAKYVNTMKTNSTKDAINNAINLLKHDRQKITLRRISEFTGLSYPTIKRYKDYVKTWSNIL